MAPTKAPLVPVPTDEDLPRTLQPPGWPRPLGYANGMTAKGRVVVTGGVVGWDVMQNFPDTFAAQARQAFANILRILAEGGAGPEHVVRLTWYVTDLRVGNRPARRHRAAGPPRGPGHVVRLTWYVTDLDEYRAAGKELGRAYRETFGSHYPAMAVVQVAGLVVGRASCRERV